MENVTFESHIDTVIKATEQSLERAAEVLGGMMESKAKEYITEAVYQSPEGSYIRTGNLRNSISHATDHSGGSVAVVVGASAEYAPYVELGTGVGASDGRGRKTPWRYQDDKGNWHTTTGMPARPYIRPALENHLEMYKRVLQQELSKG